jgi:glycosyltransferase involved in cell wall biosynthesis
MRISVVMVVYNGEKYLREAVESVLAQTLRDFELVAVDDGSTDSSLSILNEYSKKDARIVVIQGSHGGEAAARNLGMSHATHELIAVMDADDRMRPDRLERQLWFLSQNRDVSVACSFAYFLNVEGDRIGFSSHLIDVDAGIRELNPSHFLELVHPSVMAVKADVLAVGGYRIMSLPDRDLWGRLVTAGFRIACQHEPLMEYRLHGAALSSGSLVRQAEFIDLNVVRRLRGEPEVSYDSFLEWYQSRPVLQRLRRSMSNFAKKKYKRATRHYAERRWFKCAGALTAAVLLGPGWTISRALSGISIGKTRSLSQ